MPEPEDESLVRFAVLDAALATMVAPMCGQGRFTVADRDCLLSAWSATVERCPRSRLFLRLMRTGRPADALWPVVDGVLAPQAR